MYMDRAQGTIAVVHTAVVQLAVQPEHRDDAEMDTQVAGNEDKQGAVVQKAHSAEPDLVQTTYAVVDLPRSNKVEEDTSEKVVKDISPVLVQGTEAAAGHPKNALDAQLPLVLADEAVAAGTIGNQLQNSESEAGHWDS